MYRAANVLHPVILKKMIDSEDESLRLHVGDELADVAAQPLDLAVLRLVQPPYADVDALAGLRKVRLHLFPDEEILHVRVFVQQVERAVDGVVVGQGDVRHPPFLGDAVDVFGRVVAVSGIGAPEVLEHGETAVAVQIRTFQAGIRKSFRRRFDHRVRCRKVPAEIVQLDRIFYNSRARVAERLSVAQHQRTNGTISAR